MDSRECYTIASRKIVEIFGRDYLQKNKSNITITYSELEKEFMVFVTIKNHEECPLLKPNELGWSVYATVFVDKYSGEITNVDFQREE